MPRNGASRLFGLWTPLMVLVLAAGSPVWAEPAPASLAAGPVCVAVIEPEVLADLPPAQRNALAAALDTLLSQSLARQQDFVPVDRQALDKVLAEKVARAAGFLKIAPGEVAAPLRPFWAAGVLVCPTIRQTAKEGGKPLVHVEAVAAQTGQLLAELFEPQTWKKGQWVGPLLPANALDAFWRDVRRGIAPSAGLPLVEIADGRLVSELNRGQWMVDDLADALRAETAADRRCTLLIARQPASTKEERLLRLMGLSARKAGDAAAGLAPAPRARLTFDLDEPIALGPAAEKTPLTLKLTWSAGAAKAVNWSGHGAAGQWDALRGKAIAWVRGRRAELGGGATAADDEQSARQMAQQELDLVRRWQRLQFWTPDNHLEVQRCCRLVTHALRAAHLDPASEEAAYNVAMHIDALYPADGRDDCQPCQDRIIAECRRYLDRFDRRTREDRRQAIVDRMAMAALRCAAMVAPRRGLALSSRQNAELYRYASIYIPVWIERDAADAARAHCSNPGFGNLWASSWVLRLDLIMNCPADQLDAEHARWRKFWRDRLEKLGDDAPPWDLIEIFFQIRYKDWSEVRAAYQRLAGKYDESLRRIWYYGETPVLPHTLRAARDPQWSTWQPVFAEGLAREIRQQDFEFVMNLVWPPFLDAGPNGPSLPASKMVLPNQSAGDLPWGGIPERVLAVIDGQMWIASFKIDRANGPTQLWLAGVPDEPAEARRPLGGDHWLGAKSVPVRISPQVVPWPAWNGRSVEPSLTCWLLSQRNGQVDLLLGTRAHGIARFTRKDGRWHGRWITTREGLPVKDIDAIAACRFDEKTLWVVFGSDAQKEHSFANGQKYMAGDSLLWTIDPENGTVRILFRGLEHNLREALGAGPLRQAYYAIRLPAEVMALLDVEKTAAADATKFRWEELLVPAGRRLWRIKDSTLTELSAKTLKPIAATIGGTARWNYLPGLSQAESLMMFGSFSWGTGSMQATHDWPVNQPRIAIGWRDSIVMVLGGGLEDHLIAIYRPAPPGSADWAADDHWAFYAAPEKCGVLALYVDAQDSLWLATTVGLLRLNAAQLPSLETIWGSASTEQYRQDWWKRTGCVWKREIAAKVARKQWEQALQGIARYAADEPNWALSDDLKKWERLAVPFWRARVYAEQPGMAGKAVEIYAALAANRQSPDAARLLARICQVLVLHQAQRWQDVVAVYDQATTEFPQLKAKRGEPSDTLAPLVEEARRKHLQPASARPERN